MPSKCKHSYLFVYIAQYHWLSSPSHSTTWTGSIHVDDNLYLLLMSCSAPVNKINEAMFKLI